MPRGTVATVAAAWAADVSLGGLIEAARSTERGCLNLQLCPSALIGDTVRWVLERQEAYGTFTLGERKTIVCEFSSPNLAQQFKVIGSVDFAALSLHESLQRVRSTIMGSFVARVHTAMGYRVFCENFLGDWGMQYGYLAVAFARFGTEELLQREPTKHLYELTARIMPLANDDPSVHQEAQAFFKRMEDGHAEALDTWRTMRAASVMEYQRLYSRLNVHFDLFGGKSLHLGQLGEVLELL